jgi:hypothetical protein
MQLILKPILGALFVLPTAGLVPEAEARPITEATSEFGEPLFVNGKRITDNEIKRFLVYTVGRSQVAYRKIDLIIDDELRQRAWFATLDEEAELLAQKEAAGEKSPTDKELEERRLKRYDELYEELSADAAVPDETFQAEYDRRIEKFTHRYPILNLEAEISRAYKSVPEFRRMLHQSMYFDRVFLPDNPAEWPAVAVEAFLADPAGGDLLLEDAKDSYVRRLKWKQDNDLDEIPPDDDLLKQIHRQIVRDAVFSLVSFKTKADGLPEDQIMWADTDGDGNPEVIVTTDDLWDEISPLITPDSISRGKRYLALLEATRDRMASEGILLDDAEVDRVFREYEEQFAEETFGVDVAAQQTEGFPSVESWKIYQGMREGFRRSIAESLEPNEEGEQPEVLVKHRPYAHKNLGLAKVDAEVMLISAFDWENNQWKKDGWEWARKKADEVMEMIDSHRDNYADQRQREMIAKAKGEELGPEVRVPDPYVFWSQMIDDNSEWWDPPPPTHGKQSMINYKKGGRFGPKFRNDLLGFVGETPFDGFVFGDMLTDFLFYEQEINTIAGPFCGSKGYYITKVVRRTGPTRSLSLSEPHHVQRVKDDYLRVAFRDYSQESLENADVKGLPPRCYQ